MGQINQVQAQRVWQRVRGSEQVSAAPDLSALIANAWQNGAVYLRLSQKVSGKESIVLHRMFEQEEASCSCLKGIYTITTGQKPEIPRPEPIHGSMEQVLRTCYGREMRSASAYDARGQDPEYGHVFLRLKEQEQEHCRRILELIGKLSRK